jgi:micrococcal nuclease
MTISNQKIGLPILLYFFIGIFFITSKALYANDQNYGDIKVDYIGTVYDGDTFFVTIKQWPNIIGENIPIRLKGVDTPEMKGACYQEILKAREAKKFTVQRLRSAKKVELKNMNRDKYFRIDADVFIDGKNLAQELINNRLGVSYSGGVKIDWCQKTL